MTNDETTNDSKRNSACDCGDGGCGCADDSCSCGDGGCGCGGEKTTSNDAAQERANESEKKFDPYQDFPLPKPTLTTLATTLAQQAMVSMGILPNPATGKAVFMMNQATHLIDAVELIFEKTEGNRSEEETKIIENIVHELRMLYVAASNEKSRRDAEKK